MIKKFILSQDKKILFKSLSNAKIVKVPNGVEYIGDFAFANRKKLKYIELPESLKYIGVGAFSGCSNLRIINIPNSVISLGDNSFSDCSKLEYAYLSDNLDTLNNNLFQNCFNLRFVNIPKSIVALNINFLEGLKDVEVSLSNSIPRNILFWKNKLLGSAYLINLNSHPLKKIIPKKNIIHNRDMSKIKSLFVKDGASLLNSTINNIKKIHYDGLENLIKDTPYFSNNPDISVYKKGRLGKLKVLLSADKKIMYRYFLDKKIVKIPSYIEKIHMFAFKGKKKLEHIELPEGLKALEMGVFFGCSNLRNIVIPSSVIYLGNAAFYDCFNLKDVVILGNIKFISFCTFNNCYSLKRVVIPDSVKSIEFDAFNNCTSLKKVHLPKNLKTMGYSFNGCKRLEEINIPEKLDRLKDKCFLGCYNIKNIIIENDNFLLETDCTSSLETSDICRFLISKIPREHIGKSIWVSLIEDILDSDIIEDDIYFTFVNKWKFLLRKDSFWKHIADSNVVEQYRVEESHIIRLINFMVEENIINKKNFRYILESVKFYNNYNINATLLEFQSRSGIEINLFEDLDNLFKDI